MEGKRAAGQGQADGVDCADLASSSGFDGRADVGVEVGGPFAAEAVGDLPIHGAGPQGAFGTVVGGAEGSVGDEHEQVAAGPGDELDRLVSGVAGPGSEPGCG